ncbi:unnamed protein product, partial [Didymodactylos carnosus]
LDSILVILNSTKIQDQVLHNEESAETYLVYAALWVLSSAGSEANIADYLRTNHRTETFLTLRKAKKQALQPYVYQILANVLNEDDIKQLADPKEITSMFIDYVKQAIESPQHSTPGGRLKNLLFSLKGELNTVYLTCS